MYSSPHHRPPLVLRILVGIIGLGSVVFAAALMLSDRAPGVLKSMFGDRARRLWERIDARHGADFATGTNIPETDFVVHIAIWAVVAALVGLAIWSWRGLAVACVGVFGCSLLIELGQGAFSSRNVELHDAYGNGIGVAVGTIAAAAAYLCWSGIAASFERVGARPAHNRQSARSS